MYWLAIGPPDSLKVGLTQGRVWGISTRYQRSWNNVQIGDVVLLYATRPVKSVIGYGKVISKRREKSPFWPKEAQEKQMLWPLHLTLDIRFCLPLEKWESASTRVYTQHAVLQRAFQPLKDEIAQELIKTLEGGSTQL